METSKEEKLRPTEIGKLVEEIESMHKLKPQRIKDLCQVAKDPVGRVYVQLVGLSSKLDLHIKEELSLYKISGEHKKRDSKIYSSSIFSSQDRSTQQSYFSK